MTVQEKMQPPIDIMVETCKTMVYSYSNSIYFNRVNIDDIF